MAPMDQKPGQLLQGTRSVLSLYFSILSPGAPTQAAVPKCRHLRLTLKLPALSPRWTLPKSEGKATLSTPPKLPGKCRLKFTLCTSPFTDSLVLPCSRPSLPWLFLHLCELCRSKHLVPMLFSEGLFSRFYF